MVESHRILILISSRRMPWFEQIFLRRFHFRPVRRIPHLDPAAMPEDLETLGKNADSYFHPLFGGPLARQPLVSERKFPSETGERPGLFGSGDERFVRAGP